MENDRSDYAIFSEDRSSRYSKWSWLREKVATRDFGYCLVLTIVVIALLALISANGRKTTRMGELEGRIDLLELTLRNGTLNSTQEFENELEDLEKMVKDNTQEIDNLKYKIGNNTQELGKLRDSSPNTNTTEKTTTALPASGGKTPTPNSKNDTSNAVQSRR